MQIKCNIAGEVFIDKDDKYYNINNRQELTTENFQDISLDEIIKESRTSLVNQGLIKEDSKSNIESYIARNANLKPKSSVEAVKTCALSHRLNKPNIENQQ